MNHTHRAHHVSTLRRKSSHELDVCCLNLRLRRENKKLKEHVERLQILLSDVFEFEQEKRTLLEAFHRSCAREQELKERLKEEERKNECIRDVLEDMKYIKGAQERRQLRLKNLKQAVFRAKCIAEDMQHALTERHETIRRKNLEVKELLALKEDCILHVEETSVRIMHAEKAVRQMEYLGMNERVTCKAKRKKTPPAPVKMVHSEVSESRVQTPESRVQNMLVNLCSFSFTIFFMLFIISSFIPTFSREESSVITFTDLIVDHVKELIVPFSTVHHTGLQIDSQLKGKRKRERVD